jgi:hypothetical protein
VREGGGGKSLPVVIPLPNRVKNMGGRRSPRQKDEGKQEGEEEESTEGKEKTIQRLFA